MDNNVIITYHNNIEYNIGNGCEMASLIQIVVNSRNASYHGKYNTSSSLTKVNL